jgi:hypothetical protein
MTNDELILNLVREIHSNQNEVINSMTELTIGYNTLKNDLESGRNGYSSHEVVAMLHWVDKQMAKQEKQTDTVKNAVINWAIPLICTALVIGALVLSGTFV